MFTFEEAVIRNLEKLRAENNTEQLKAELAKSKAELEELKNKYSQQLADYQQLKSWIEEEKPTQ